MTRSSPAPEVDGLGGAQHRRGRHAGRCRGLAQLPPATDVALVTKAPVASQEAPVQPFAIFGRSTDYLTDFKGFQTFTVGGDSKNLFWQHAEVRGRGDLQHARADPGRGSSRRRRRCATR